jgi:replicative DNA helicase
MELCQGVLQRVREAQEAGELLSALVGDVADLEAEQGELLAPALTSADDLLPPLWVDLEARAAAAEGTGLPGIPTRFRHLDNLTNGLEPGLYLLAGPPKAGKTTFANQMAYQVATAGVPVVYVSFENDALDLLLKQVCRLSGQPLLKAQKGQAPLALLKEAAERLKREVPGRLYYLLGNAEMTLPKVRARAKQALARHGAPRCLVVIDYLQKMALVKSGGREMRDCVNHLSLQLRDLSRELDSPLLAVASLSREGYGPGRKPNVAALKESGNLEYDADAVWLLDPGEEVRADLRKVTLTVAAARRSPTGTVAFMLKPSCGQFTEMENER